MNPETVRGWKDLDGDTAHPAGAIDLSAVSGGVMATNGIWTLGCCDPTANSFWICSSECTSGVC
ncbi:MAG: hypothetical protein HOV71_25510 [Hamadaea sp.]|nr:hypothetical protein [Hamadaea sp.]NUT05935.1 hypothetical protein [Hamadaea sp.]